MFSFKALCAGVVVTLIAGPVLAADRAQNITLDDYSFPVTEISALAPAEPAADENLQPGMILGYDVYRTGKVVGRDPLTGTVSIAIAGQTVRIRPDTREIVDIAG
ncbi:MAG: hypothetical protein CL587_15875 [Alteromonadaceae bacterium]|nr:hypothetical protein [Alteromonadaceae bacterium]